MKGYILSVAALIFFIGGSSYADKKPVRKVVIVPLSRRVSVDKTDYTGSVVTDFGVSAYNVLYMMDVAVSDDPGKTYSISCFEYHAWNHCALPKAEAYDGEIKGDVMRIIAKRDKKGRITERAKYRIYFVGPAIPPAPQQ